MAVSGANKGGYLGATYSGFGLTGVSGWEYHVTSVQLCNVGTGSTMTVDAVHDYGGGSMYEYLLASPVSKGTPVAPISGVVILTAGQTLSLRVSTANQVSCNISYQKISV